MIRDQGAEIGRRIEAGKLHINLRLVNFLEKYSASGTYDSRAIYAAFIVADHSKSSDITWRFIEQIFSADQQPKEKGPTDLSNDQLAGLADRAGAPPSAQDMIKLGLPIPFDGHVIAANNLPLLRQLPDSGVPMVVIDGESVDGNSIGSIACRADYREVPIGGSEPIGLELTVLGGEGVGEECPGDEQ